MADACLVKESVWLDQHKFEEAEAKYQQILAQRHSGLRVEVCLWTKICTLSITSAL